MQNQVLYWLVNRIFVKWNIYTSAYLCRKFSKKFLHKSSLSIKYSCSYAFFRTSKDPFWPRDERNTILGPKVPYLNTIGALTYLTIFTRPDIAFVVNLLDRFNVEPTKRHWNRVKHVMCYFQDTIDLSLYFSYNSKVLLVGYIDVGYLFDQHKARSRIDFVFFYNGIVISWKSIEQTIVATSSPFLNISLAWV